MAKNDDSRYISPVFFLTGFAKIPLDKVVIKQDDIDSDESDEEEEAGKTMFDAMLERGHELSGTAKVHQQESQRRLEAAMAARELYSMPLGVAGKGALKATQRLKTPKTVLQEEEDLRARHKALQRQIIIPPLLPKHHQSLPEAVFQQSNGQEDEGSFYSRVLPDFRAIRTYRSLSNKFVTLHIKSLPVGQTNYAIVAAEQREERERLLLLAHQEAKVAKLALKKRLREQQQLTVSNKVRRALAYFEFVCESTSNPSQPRVAEERLGKLWQFMQLLEEWKILKGGRLLDVERTDTTLSLLHQLQENAALAFGQMMYGAKSLKTDKGGGTLPYPVLCLDGGGTARKLVLRLGTRMGITQQDDHDYGMVLDLDQNFDALEKEEPRTLKRGYTKRAVAGQDVQDGPQQQQAVEAWADAEWRSKGKSSSTMAMMVSSSDLSSPPFHRIKWPLIVKAYKLVLKRVAFVSSKLDEFNALAKVVQSPEAVLSKAQLAKWQADVELFHTTLHEHTALAHTVQRVLSKKGLSVLKRRTQARRKQLRDREKELQRLHELQLECERPKLTLAQQLKATFMTERAPKLREALELTPAEKLGAKAGEILGRAASGVVKVARKAKKEYTVRTL
uniref:Uncharacterized protein n=1 Tax=Phytophthora ramorum TaxID=164328 RepID=H3GMG1_PHYRM